MRIRAFTLIELAAALFVGSLLASFAYLTLSNLQSSVGAFSISNEASLEWKRTEWCIQQDLSSAVDVAASPDGFNIIGRGITTNYQLKNGLLIRNGIFADTLFDKMSIISKTWVDDRIFHLVLQDSSERRISLTWEAGLQSIKNKKGGGN